MTQLKSEKASWTSNRARWNSWINLKTKTTSSESTLPPTQSSKIKTIPTSTVHPPTQPKTLLTAISHLITNLQMSRPVPTSPVTKRTTTNNLIRNSPQLPKAYHRQRCKESWKTWLKNFTGWKKIISHKNKKIKTWSCIWNLLLRCTTWF
jgi:hypothetical protein